MQSVATESVVVKDALIKPAVKDIEHYLRKMYEDDPNRSFSIRMSQIGRPLCQQQMEKLKATAMQDEWNNPLRMFFGGVLEATTICILKAAGITIEEEQTVTSLPVTLSDGTVIHVSGTLDLVIDGKVWDVKSASPVSFESKFASYEALKSDDTFGYMAQLFGYSKAKSLPPGGWIVIDKSSGMIRIIPVPENYDEEMSKQLKIIASNVEALVKNSPFKRCYTEVDETFKKRYTGNKVLASPCIYCKFRYTCWPTLKYLPSVSSTAYDKPYKYYTYVDTINTKSEHENPIS